MARISLTLPSKFHFTTTIILRISDLNYGNHMGNEVALLLAHEARVQFLKALGYSELDIGGTAIIMADAAVIYKSEGFSGEAIEIAVAIENMSRAGFEIFYKMYNTDQQKDLAWVKTGIVCYDYNQRKVRPVPEEFKKKVERLRMKL